MVTACIKPCQARRRLAVDSTPSNHMEMSMLQQVIPRQETHTQNRAVALQNVESTISELSGIFTHLATMVAHQGELAIRSAHLNYIHVYFSCLKILHLAVKLKETDCISCLPRKRKNCLHLLCIKLLYFRLLCINTAWIMWSGLMIIWMSRWQMLKVLNVLYWSI